MLEMRRARIRTYGLAIGSVGLAFLLSWLLRPWILSTPSPFFTAAVVVTAWYGGLAPALISAMLAAAARQVFLLQHTSIESTMADDVVQISVFLMVACLIGALFRRVEQQREWFEVTLGSIGDAVVTVDIGARVRFMNAVAEQVTGWSRQDAVDRPVGDVFFLIKEGTGQTAENPVFQALRERRTAALLAPTALSTRSGQKIPIENSAAPICDPNGRLLGAVMVFRDVTRRRQAENERERLEQALLAAKANLERQVEERTGELSATNRRLMDAMSEQKRAEEERQRLADIAQSRERLALIGELAAGVAHELRNPLQGVMSYVQLVKMSEESREDVRPSLEQVEVGLAQMDRVAARLLDLSRRDTGPAERLDLHELIEKVCAFLQARASQQQIKLTNDAAPGLPAVHANQALLMGVLLNLLKNSLDACPEGGVVTVVARPHAGLAEMVEVLVSDTGTGIPDGIRDHIFEPFFTTKPAGEGTGLGLSLVKRAIEGYGGSVTIVDTGPKGTTISLALPAAAVGDSAESEANGEVIA